MHNIILQGSEPFPVDLGLSDLLTNITTITLVSPSLDTDTTSHESVVMTTEPTRNFSSTMDDRATFQSTSTNSNLSSQYKKLEVSVVTDSIYTMDRIAGLRKRKAQRITQVSSIHVYYIYTSIYTDKALEMSAVLGIYFQIYCLIELDFLKKFLFISIRKNTKVRLETCN